MLEMVSHFTHLSKFDKPVFVVGIFSTGLVFFFFCLFFSLRADAAGDADTCVLLAGTLFTRYTITNATIKKVMRIRLLTLVIYFISFSLTFVYQTLYVVPAQVSSSQHSSFIITTLQLLSKPHSPSMMNVGRCTGVSCWDGFGLG